MRITNFSTAIRIGLLTTLLLLISKPPLAAHPPGSQAVRQLADREPDQQFNQEEEDVIHTPSGFQQPGRVLTLKEQDPETAVLRVKIVDASSGAPTPCRVNVVGPRGQFYEPHENPLSPWSRQQTAQNETYGPSRYYGYYFYTLGEFEIRVPVGKVSIEAWKGYEYLPVQKKVSVTAGETDDVQLQLRRTVAMEEFGYYSGDTHIHLNRRNEEDDDRALDLMAAEDIEYGFLLCMNDPRTYTGIMERQEWPQDRGIGSRSIRTRGRYGIASGQEYRASTYGHICLLMHDRLVLDGLTVNPTNWPTLDIIGRETRGLGGFSFHAHGGYSAGIYADYLQRSTDGVELLQMAHYRGIGLTGWYRILNVGYRYPGLAGSDFPYCRCLGDCRNYVYAGKRPTFVEWARNAAAGHSFFTTGPLLLLEVDGRRPGETIELSGNAKSALKVTARVRSEVAHVENLDLIVNGRTVKSMAIFPTGRDHWHELQHSLSDVQPCWIAARAYSLSATGKPDAEAHTNPVYVYVDGEKPFSADDRDWLLAKLNGRVQLVAKREFPEKEQVLKSFRESRDRLLELSSSPANIAEMPPVPIDVGARKQLFFDKRFIADSSGVELVMNTPRRDGEVLLTTDQPWEQGRDIGVYSSVVKENGKVRVWYDFRQHVKEDPYRELRVSYAESEDGLHFSKPLLGLHEVDGSTANNVVLPGLIGGCSVWVDPQAPPEHRYKNQAKVYPSAQLHMHSSPDGIHWKKFARIDPGAGGWDTQTIVFWDPKITRYVMYTRRWVIKEPQESSFRTVRRLESDDLLDWDSENVVMEADELDLATHKTPTQQPPVDYYGADVFRYDGADDVYIMLAQAFWHWQRRSSTSGLGPAGFDVRLAISRDGKTFQRAGGWEPFMATGPDGGFDSRMVWAMPHPIRMGNELWIYYVGVNRDHDGVIDPLAADKHLTGIGRAVLRLDGFVSADAGYGGGQITTPLIRFSGRRLELNVETGGGGSVVVEVLDAEGRPVADHSRADAIAVNGNSVHMPVTWKKGGDVASLAGQPVRLRFHMQDCKLYAFQFREQ